MKKYKKLSSCLSMLRNYTLWKKRDKNYFLKRLKFISMIKNGIHLRTFFHKGYSLVYKVGHQLLVHHSFKLDKTVIASICSSLHVDPPSWQIKKILEKKQ